MNSRKLLSVAWLAFLTISQAAYSESAPSRMMDQFNDAARRADNIHVHPIKAPDITSSPSTQSFSRYNDGVSFGENEASRAARSFQNSIEEQNRVSREMQQRASEAAEQARRDQFAAQEASRAQAAAARRADEVAAAQRQADERARIIREQQEKIANDNAVARQRAMEEQNRITEAKRIQREAEEEAERYRKYWEERAPVQSRPFDVRRRYTEHGEIKQVTTYDDFGRRHRQYDLIDGRRAEHQHNFDYGPNTPNGVRSSHLPIKE